MIDDIPNFVLDFTNDANYNQPSWLLHDIEALRQSKMNNYSKTTLLDARSNKEARQYISKTLPKKINDYKHFRKEISKSFNHALISTEVKPKKSLEPIVTERKVNVEVESYLNKLKLEREQKKLLYMKQAQRPVSSNYVRSGPRSISPKMVNSSKISSALSTRASTAIGERPHEPSTRNSHDKKRDSDDASIWDCYNSNSRSSSPLEKSCQLKKSESVVTDATTNQKHKAKFMVIVDETMQRQKMFLEIITIIKYANYLKRFIILKRAYKMRVIHTVRKLTKWYLHSKEVRKLQILSSFPGVVRRYIQRTRRKIAIKRIYTFLSQIQKIKSSTVVKRYLNNVRKIQKLIRKNIEIKKCRIILLTKLWDKIERNYRKQLDDNERETQQRLVRDRNMRINDKSGDVSEKWNIVNHQVNSLLLHIESVQSHKALVVETMNKHTPLSKVTFLPDTKTNGISGKMNTSTFEEMIDADIRNNIILKYLRLKKKLHYERINEIYNRHHNNNSKEERHEVIDINTVRKVLKNYQQNSRELLRKQLMEAGLAPNGRHIGKHAAIQLNFLCLTDPTLGKPWKNIVEDTVRMDIIRKKKMIHEQNMREVGQSNILLLKHSKTMGSRSPSTSPIRGADSTQDRKASYENQSSFNVNFPFE